jgi:hypothetical protein
MLVVRVVRRDDRAIAAEVKDHLGTAIVGEAVVRGNPAWFIAGRIIANDGQKWRFPRTTGAGDWLVIEDNREAPDLMRLLRVQIGG